MKCNLENRESLISKYLLNELSDDERLIFEEHYFGCEQCFKELKTAEEALGFIKLEGKSLKETQPKKNILDKIFGSSSNSLKWAVGFASVIILLIIGYSIFKTTPVNKTEEIIIGAEKDSLQNIAEEKIKSEDSNNIIKEPQNLIAELSGPSFKSNLYYEEWINENVRSSNNIVEKVLSPAVGDTITKASILFNFILKENIPVRLIVLDNLENEVKSIQLNQTESLKYQFRMNASDLKSGLYYWKMEDEREVLFIGKFYLVKK